MKLTQHQQVVLSSACDNELGFATRPNGLNAGQAARISSSLIAKGLIKEIRAKPGVPVWRQDDGRQYALKILKSGRDAIEVRAEPTKADQHDPITATAKAKSRSRERPSVRSLDQGGSSLKTSDKAAPSPRAGSKQAIVVDMLRDDNGVTIEALVSATGWLPHTTRAALTGLRKKGFAIERDRREGASSTYRIVMEPSQAAA